MYKTIIFLIATLVCANFTYAQLQIFEGNVFTGASSLKAMNLIQQDTNSLIRINSQDQIRLMSERDVLEILDKKKQYSTNGDASYTDYNPALVYFKVKSVKTGLKQKWTLYAMPRATFIYKIKEGDFGTREKAVYEKEETNVLSFRKKFKRFDGKVAVINKEDSYKVFSTDLSTPDVNLVKEQQVYILPEEENPGYPLNDQGKVYFHLYKSGTKEIDKSKTYYMQSKDLEKNIQDGIFNNWFKNTYNEQGGIVREIEYKKKLRLKVGKEPIKLTRLTGNEEISLGPEQEFYIEQHYPEDLVVIPPSLNRYLINGNLEFEKAFNQGDFNDVKQEFIVQTPKYEPAAKQEAPKKSIPPSVSPQQVTLPQSEPQLQDIVQAAEVLLTRVENFSQQIDTDCDPALKRISSVANKCTSSDSFYQDKLANEMNVAEIHSTSPAKYCIMAGLKEAPYGLKYAKCSDDNKLIGSQKACKSEEYVAFIHRSLNKVSRCFKNISLQEMLPLANMESRFHLNAYNLNTGRYADSLNASGLMQVTQSLMNSQDSPFVTGRFTAGSSFDRQYQEVFNSRSQECIALRQDIIDNPIETETKEIANTEVAEIDNVCKRTQNPKNIEKIVFLAFSQYSNAKKVATNLMDEYGALYQAKKGRELFSNEDKETISVDLARLMHNRGTGAIRRRLATFVYDLSKGHLVNELGTTPVHGNPRIGSFIPNRDQDYLMNAEDFKNYFSSYILYQEAGSSRVEPSSKNLEKEGGVYLHQIACDQKRMTDAARKLADNKRISCGYPVVKEKEAQEVILEAAWFYNICKQENTSIDSQKVCQAKDPYTATENSLRRLSDKRITSLKKQKRFLKLCDRDSLFGLAARPLREAYK